MISDQFLRWYLPIYGAVYLLCLVGRSLFVSLRIGKSPLVFERRDTVYDYVVRWFQLVRLMVVVSIVIIVLVGVFLLLPHALSLLTCVLGLVLMQIQVRLEEDFMTRTHGDEYHEYCRTVRRWL